MASHNSQRDDFMSDINVTPLVDVMLVLLIVMMVATSYVVTRALKVDLPNSNSKNEADSSLVVEVDASGGLHLDGAACSEAELRHRLRSARNKSNTPSALIAADGDTPHRAVVRAMDILREESITKVAIAVRPSP
ncbi:MAG TPA: biopolymer transporter ExbD [Polyangiaceae bacterium]|jgi:biopolymer transport protein ExbD|nr:biopolymer transporter ExbD [Polyangiaceae bacterium]